MRYIADDQPSPPKLGDSSGGLTAGSVAEFSQCTAKLKHLEGLVGHLDTIKSRGDVDLERASLVYTDHPGNQEVLH